MAIPILVDIEIDGKRIPDFQELRIEQELAKPNSFSIICGMHILEGEDGYSMEKSRDYLGREIKIEIQSRDMKRPESNLFKGVVTNISTTRESEYKGNQIVISGYSPDISLHGSLICRSFTEMTLEQIAGQLLKDGLSYQMKPQVRPKNSKSIPYTVQYQENNYNFLKRLCARMGEWFLFDGMSLHIGELPDIEVDLIQGYNMSSFDYSVGIKPLDFEYVNYSYLSSQEFRSSSKNQKIDGNLDENGKIALQKSPDVYPFGGLSLFNQPLADYSEQSELDARVKLEKGARGTSMVAATGESESLGIYLGSRVNVKGLKDSREGVIDYGRFIITSIKHSCTREGHYRNSFTAVPSSVQFPPQTDPSLVPVCRTQSAKVTDVDDPEKLGRIKVSFPWQVDGDETPWLRIASPYAGKEKGIYFVPEIDEEVLVGFENDDAEKPYVAGTVFNGKAKPKGDGIDQDNNIKSIRTRSGHVILFDDTEGKEEIIIQDAKEQNRIVISAHEKSITITSEDSMTFDARGSIKIKAGGDINMKASGSCQISAGGNLDANTDANMTLKASGNTDMSADGNLSAKANGNLTASANGNAQVKGNGTAELSAAGNTTVRGAMVMIN